MGLKFGIWEQEEEVECYGDKVLRNVCGVTYGSSKELGSVKKNWGCKEVG